MRYSRKNNEPGRTKKRIILVGAFFSLMYLIIAGRVVYLQVFRGDVLASRASGEYMRTFVTAGKRGTIYDRNHTEMAVTVDAMSIGLHPALIADPDEIAPRLAKVVNMTPEVVRRKLASKRSFVWLKRKTTAGETAAVREIGLENKAVEYVQEQKRVYPNNSLAAQLIGFTGIDGNGLEGIEYSWDEELSGASISQTVLMDARQRCLDGGEVAAESADGNNIILTIDGAIQYIAETAVEKAVVDSEAVFGMAIEIGRAHV